MDRHPPTTLRVSIDWLRGEQHEPSFEETIPPGLSEGDSAFFAHPESISIFVPSEHDQLKSLGDVADLADLLEPTNNRIPDAPPARLSEVNIDRLAWYTTFRAGDPWGIFIREVGLATLAQALAGPNGPTTPTHQSTAFHVLYLHEYGHFLLDVAARSLEAVIGSDLYLPHRAETTRGVPGYHELTEALCNAFAYRNAHARGLRSRLRPVLRGSPSGYRDFVDFIDPVAFSAGVESVLGEMLRGAGGQPAFGARGLFDERSDVVSPSLVPIRLVREPSTPPILALITALGSIGTTSAFQRGLRKLPEHVQQTWASEVEPALRTDVRTHNWKRLSDGRFSARVSGNYRVILERSKEGWTAVQIGHRREVYRNRG
jgi:hypothetical protein